MVQFSASLKTPFFIAVGDHDFVRIEHSVEIFHIILNAELAVVPDAGHFVLYADQQKVMPAIVTFFEAPAEKLPFSTTTTGYQPGETR